MKTISIIMVFILLIAYVAFYFLSEGVTPLMRVAKEGNVTKVEKAINNKSINKKSRFGWTALMFASAEGHEKVVNMLLHHKANPNISSGKIPARFDTTGDYPSTTALAEAFKYNHKETVKTLLKNGALPDNNAIALMGSMGDIDLAKLMISKGADIDISGYVSYYPSALCMAAKEGHLEMVKFLILHGANPNKVHYRSVALEKAVVSNNPKVVKYLLEHKANPNIKLFSTSILYDACISVTGLHTKNEYRDNLTIIKQLLFHGADKNYKPFDDNKTIRERVIKLRQDFETGPYKNEKSSQHLFTVLRMFDEDI